MFREKTPTDLSFDPVFVVDSSGKKYRAEAAIKTWTPKEAFWRGLRKSARIVGVLIAILLPFGFIEPFAFMVWGSITLGFILVVVGPVLHLTYWSEPVSFFYIDTQCPNCQEKAKLTPYISTAYNEEFTALCPACGQTTRVIQRSV